MRRFLPILDWAPGYDRATLTDDLLAAVIVTIMLIPQSLAYALLAGLPPEVGLYASMAPLVIYAVFGTSRTLAVGPVAVASLMTAAAVGEIAARGTPEYLGAAILLAFLSGAMLLLMGVLRLGFLANFLSHPVISGFITASGLLIAASQLRHILGIDAHGHTLLDLGRTPRRACRRNQPAHPSHRRRRARVPLLGASLARSAPAADATERRAGLRPDTLGSGGGCRRHHPADLGARPAPTGRRHCG